MSEDRIARVAAVLRQAGETHHAVYALVDGADDDWATWYSDWLVNRSALPEVLGAAPVRARLTAVLVRAADDHAASGSDEPWAAAYARAVVEAFG